MPFQLLMFNYILNKCLKLLQINWGWALWSQELKNKTLRKTKPCPQSITIISHHKLKENKHKQPNEHCVIQKSPLYLFHGTFKWNLIKILLYFYRSFVIFIPLTLHPPKTKSRNIKNLYNLLRTHKAVSTIPKNKKQTNKKKRI